MYHHWQHIKTHINHGWVVPPGYSGLFRINEFFHMYVITFERFCSKESRCCCLNHSVFR